MGGLKTSSLIIVLLISTLVYPVKIPFHLVLGSPDIHVMVVGLIVHFCSLWKLTLFSRQVNSWKENWCEDRAYNMLDKTMKPQCKILNCITKMGLPEKLRKNNTSAFTCTQADYAVYYPGKEFKINKWSNHQPSSDNKNNSHNHRNHRAGLVHRPTTMCTVLPR